MHIRQVPFCFLFKNHFRWIPGWDSTNFRATKSYRKYKQKIAHSRNSSKIQ
jgi:hypothetical protein